MKLSVIIPSRNGGALLSEHLPAVCQEARSISDGSEVIVVDDASDVPNDSTEASVAAAAPTARLVRRSPHAGFAPTVNAGAREALGEHLLFLNNDMHPTPGAFSTLVKALESWPEAFAVTPVIMNLAGGFPESTTRARFSRGVFDVLFPGREGLPPPRDTEWREVAYACGGAFICRRVAFEELGGFPELHAPFYWEDADLGWRARRRGWSNREIGGARILHDHSRTIGALYSPREIRTIYERNRLLFTWLHLSGAGAWLSHLAWMPVRLVAALVRGEPLPRSLVQALGELARVRAERRRMSETRSESRRLLGKLHAAQGAGWPR